MADVCCSGNKPQSSLNQTFTGNQSQFLSSVLLKVYSPFNISSGSILDGKLFIYLFVYLFIYLFIIVTRGHFFIAFRERGGEMGVGGEGERERDLLPSCTHPNQRTCNLGMCPDQK